MDSTLSDDQFRLLLEYLDRPWSGYRKVRKGVKKRVRRHMRLLGVSDIDQYLHLLSRDQEIKSACEKCLEVTISRFFRDRRLWVYLKDELLPLAARMFPDGVRAWAIGCGCGEEAYSLAIVWHQLQSRVDFTILASDINPQNLARAQKGCFQQSSMKEVPHSIRVECFEKQEKGSIYCIDERFKENITWQRYDLFSPLASDPFHIIFLRNSLLTYYKDEQCNHALTRILKLMLPGGYLVIGSHENIPEHFDTLRRDQACPHVYIFAQKGI